MNSQTDAYKALASAVIVSAIDDLTYVGKNKALIRRQAKEFLIGEAHSEIRAFWLSWLDLDELGLRRLVLAKNFKGQTNQLRLAA